MDLPPATTAPATLQVITPLPTHTADQVIEAAITTNNIAEPMAIALAEDTRAEAIAITAAVIPVEEAFLRLIRGLQRRVRPHPLGVAVPVEEASLR